MWLLNNSSIEAYRNLFVGSGIIYLTGILRTIYIKLNAFNIKGNWKLFNENISENPRSSHVLMNLELFTDSCVLFKVSNSLVKIMIFTKGFR